MNDISIAGKTMKQGDDRMEIIRDEKAKIIEVWLSKTEATDDKLAERLRPLYLKWKQQKYMTCVYRSGGRNLQEQTAGLLRHNRDYFARKELENTRQQIAAEA